MSLLCFQGIGLCLGETIALKPVSGELCAGLTWVTGDEGAGKTTLLRLLGGERAPSCGLLSGALMDLARACDQPLSAQVFWQDPRSDALDAMVAREYLVRQCQRWPLWNEDLLGELLDTFDLNEHLDKRFDMLSAGTKRKLWLATAFASGAALTLLDEPFAALDRPSIRAVMEWLEDTVGHPRRAWVVADYEVPEGLEPDAVIELPA